MEMYVCQGAVLQCSFGAAPALLTVLPAAKVMTTQALASIMDQVPYQNIMPFGMCSSMANPTVAAATAAALGVLTPMPCTPVFPLPWAPGNPKVMIGKYPALTGGSKVVCAWGGVVSIGFPGTVNLMTG